MYGVPVKSRRTCPHSLSQNRKKYRYVYVLYKTGHYNFLCVHNMNMHRNESSEGAIGFARHHSVWHHHMDKSAGTALASVLYYWHTVLYSQMSGAHHML
jgi:hypothetical protein